MDDLLTRIQNWWNAPFQPSGNVLQWGLFVVLIITIAFMWTRILRELD